MHPDDKMSVLTRTGRSTDAEYWCEVGRHITGILGTAQSLKFVQWMCQGHFHLARYMRSEQDRVNLLLEFDREQYRIR